MPGKLVHWVIGFLVASAVLNAALLGMLVKRSEVAQAATPPPARNDGVRPVSAEVQAAWAKVPEPDRKAMSKQFIELRQASADDYKRLVEASNTVAETAGREPFNERDLRDAVVVYRHFYSTLQAGVDNVLISHLSNMPADAREVAARGLLTPYSQWMRPPRIDPGSASTRPRPKATSSPPTGG